MKRIHKHRHGSLLPHLSLKALAKPAQSTASSDFSQMDSPHQAMTFPKMYKQHTLPATHPASWASPPSSAAAFSPLMWQKRCNHPMSSSSTTNTGNINTTATQRSSDRYCS